MYSLLYLILAAIQGVCLVLAIRNFARTRSSYDILPILVIGGLVYDNLVIAAGTTVGEGEALQTLNSGRFFIHALFTPLLIIWGYGVARRVGLGWAQSRRNHAIFCTLAVAMIVLGAYSDIVSLSLEPRLENETLRYVNAGGLKGPPIPAIVTILVLIGVGVALWRRTRSWGLAAGSIVMFICAMAGVRIPLVSSIGEVAMSAGVISGEGTVIAKGRQNETIVEVATARTIS